MAARPNQLAQRLTRRSGSLLGALLAVALLVLPLPAAPVYAAFQDDPHSYPAVLRFEQTLANPFPGDGFRGGLDGIVSPSGVRLPAGHIYKIQVSYLDSWGGRVTYYTRNDRDASCDGSFHIPIGEGSQQLGFSALVPYQGDRTTPVYLCLNYHIGWQSAGIVIRVYDVFANTLNTTDRGFATELALDSQHSFPDNLYQFTLTASGPITVSNVVEWVYHYNADRNAPPIDGDPLRTTSRMNVQIVVVPPGVSAGVTIYTNEAQVFSAVGQYLFEVFSPSGDPGIALFSVETTPAPATSTPTSSATTQPPPSGCGGTVADVGQLPTQPAPPGPQATSTPCPATPSPTPTCGGTGAGGGVQDLPNAPTVPPPPGPQPTATSTPCPAMPSPTPDCGGTGAGGGVQELPNAPTIPPPPGPQPTPTSTPAACNTTTPTTPPTAPTCPISSFSRVSIPQRPAWQILPMELRYIVYSFRNTVLVEYPYNSGAYLPIPDTPVRWASLGAAGWYRFSSDDALAELAICNPPPATATPTRTPPATATAPATATSTASATTTATASASATPTSSSTPSASPTASPVGTPYVFPTDVGGVVCVPTATAQRDPRGPLPDLALTLPTWQPLPTLVLTASDSLSMSLVISPVQTMVALFLPPVATLTAWCNGQFGPDGWARGSADSTPLVLAAAGAFGWLTLFSLFGPLNWLLPPLVLSLLVRVVRAILSMVKYVKQLLPFQ